MGNRQGQRTDLQPEQNFAQVKGQKSAEIAAKKSGFGNKETYRQAKKVVDTVPELVNAMNEVAQNDRVQTDNAPLFYKNLGRYQNFSNSTTDTQIKNRHVFT